MEPDEITTELAELEATDPRPKPVYQDETAYLITAAGLAAYAQTNDIRILVLLVTLYVVGNTIMRIVSQVLESKERRKG